MDNPVKNRTLDNICCEVDGLHLFTHVTSALRTAITASIQPYNF